MALDLDPFLSAARLEERAQLDDEEALALVKALGLAVPATLTLARPADLSAANLRELATPTVVVKASLAGRTHRARSGAVAVVAADVAVARAAMEKMTRLPGVEVTGFTVAAFVTGDPGVGELLVGVRRSREFGPVALVGPGGVHAERQVGRNGFAMLPAGELAGPGAVAALRATGLVAGERAAQLCDVLRRLAGVLQSPEAADLADLELNPLVWTAGGPVALDVLVRRQGPEPSLPAASAPRDLRPLFEPASIAVVGASARRRNPGRIILQQIVAAGFDPERLVAVHADGAPIDGVRTVPDVASLPKPCDLVVLAVGADATPAVLGEIVRLGAARSVIAVPGGLGEREGTEERARDLVELLRDARARGAAPAVVGGNSMGVASGPGRYDATFVSRVHVHGLERGREEEAPLAVLSQSGALALTTQSRLGGLRPRYMVSIGNQLDLTHGEVLEYLAADTAVQVYACYVEGFAPGDGARWLAAAQEITASGRQVVLYRAGRTAAGAAASSSHTASIAGDYATARALAARAGVAVAETLEELADAIRLLVRFADRPVAGRRLGVLSNAGFECVAAADHLGALELARFAPETVRRLDAVLESARLAGVVNAHNPMDVTPTAGDAAFAEAARAVLDDEGVDVALLGCVPFTDALSTALSETPPEHDLVAALGEVVSTSGVPCAVVVDAGPAYDPLRRRLEDARIPTFRTMDRAVRAFDLFCGARAHELAEPHEHHQNHQSPEEMARW